MKSENTPPLPADPARQAEAMLRGCEYQILHTVSAWLDLRGEEVLHVEGAEDFDCVTHDGGEAVQIKSSEKPISLGQKEIQETLNNFWGLIRAAGGRNVSCRYLTRASFAVERGSPFGSTLSCLEVWQRRSIEDNDVLALASFLAGRDYLCAPFKQWLRTATPTELRSELIERVTWQTQSGDSESVERSINNKLMAYAGKQGRVSSSVVRAVRLRLVQEVLNVLRKPAPRQLDLYVLGEIWEDVESVRVSKVVFDSMLAAGGTRHRDYSDGQGEVLRSGLPPLPGKVTKRTKIVLQLAKTLMEKGVINITGSSRTGKTTLAKLLATADAGNWRWWSGAGKQIESIERSLDLMIREAASDPLIKCLILDDVDFSASGIGLIEEQLGELVALLLNRRGKLIITSQRTLSSRLRHKYGVEADQCVAVPRLKLEEIEEVADEFGCQDVENRSGWASIVLASTGGHPLLVGARMMALKDGGWPRFSAESLTVGDHAIDAEKADARQLLHKLPKGQRELVHRLSVFPSAFRREHAIAFGAAPPPLTAPGHLFDPLVGPWVEPLHEGYFALSPLLVGGAKANLAPADLMALQEQAALALLETDPCYPSDAASAFLLGWQARSERLLNGFVLSWVNSDELISEALADELRWLASVAVVPGESLFPENAALSLLLRCIQFRVAALIGANRVVNVYNAWVDEIGLCGVAERPAFKMLIAVQLILSTKRAALPAHIWVGAIGFLSEALLEDPDVPLPGSFPDEQGMGVDYLPKWGDPVCMISFICGTRCETVEFLDSFLTAIESIQPELRGRILRGFIGAGPDAMMAIDRVWLHESDKIEPNWSTCIQVFQRTLKLGLAWECVPLSDAGLKGLCVVHEEYLNDEGSAFHVLDEASLVGGVSGRVIHDRRAGLFFNARNYEAAGLEWHAAFEAWPKPMAPFDSYAAFAARNAGICAARLEKWSIAAAWFERMIEYSPKEMGAALSAGAYAEWGYCLWKASLKTESLSALIQAWKLADTLPTGLDNFRAFVTRKAIGHVIAWLHGVVMDGGRTLLHEPIVGVCSSQELPEGLRDYPETESANVWVFLARMERELGGSSEAVELSRVAFRETQNVATRSLIATEAIGQALASGKVENLPAEVVEMVKALEVAAANRPEHEAVLICSIPAEEFNKDDGLSGTSVFLAGLVVSRAAGVGWEEILEKWRRCPSVASRDSWSRWFDAIECVLGGDISSSVRIVRDQNSNWSSTMLAAWHICISDSLAPETLFYAHARWLIEIRSSPWLRQTGGAFCFQVILAWKNAVQRRALLRTPRLTVPAIEEACADGENSLGKAARILLAACAAVEVKLPFEIRGTIHDLAIGD